MTIRRAQPADAAVLAGFRHDLWPRKSVEDHLALLAGWIAGEGEGVLPLLILVAEKEGGEVLGYLEVSLRSFADGCDRSKPVGYLEAWYVASEHRRKGVGAALARRGEEWARSQGCSEMASDTWIDHETAQEAHAALGYEVVDRCVHYRKALY
jgi:aminoglycoside 6'-N-acetyltransferase I